MEINLASKRYKGNNGLIKFMNLQSVEGIRDGDIPEWLLFEVLLRLSTKLVFRFKLVSKQWLDTILDPSFVRAYISRASFLPNPWIFISNIMPPRYSPNSRFPDHTLFDDNDDICYDKIINPSYIVLPPPRNERQTIFGVSNGLVLCGSYGSVINFNFYIYNPVTSHWIALPPLVTGHEWPASHDGLYRPLDVWAGWGFVTRLGDGNFLESCRVVRISTLIEKKSNNLRFEVFFSETGEWKDIIVCSDIKYNRRFSRKSAFLNGILHWIAKEHGIIAYDPYQSPDRIRLIAFPSDIINCHKQMACNCLCDEYEGKLRYFEVYGRYLSSDDHFPHISLWILNDYSSGEWCLLHKISNTDIRNDMNFSFSLSFLKPISFHPYNPNVRYLQYGDVLVSYDMKNKRIEVHPKFSNGKNLRGRQEWWRDFLLVVPPWPISMPSSFSGAANA